MGMNLDRGERIKPLAAAMLLGLGVEAPGRAGRDANCSDDGRAMPERTPPAPCVKSSSP